MNIFTNCFLKSRYSLPTDFHCKNYLSIIRDNGDNRSCATVSSLRLAFSSFNKASIHLFGQFFQFLTDVVSAFTCNDMKKFQYKN